MIEEDEYIGTTTPEEDDMCDGECWNCIYEDECNQDE
jgi:hypothetical protein